MSRIKAHWKALTVLLALVLWAAWYSRPVGVYTLAPGMKEPDTMDFTLWAENSREAGETLAEVFRPFCR